MTKAGERLIEGVKEALAIARGEQPAAAIAVGGHTYVPVARIAEEREACAKVAEQWLESSWQDEVFAARTIADAIRARASTEEEGR